jgi:hypothetical protein
MCENPLPDTMNPGDVSKPIAGDSVGTHSTGPRILFLELFVAFSLFMAYFFMVRSFFVYGEPMNSNVFTAGSEKLSHLNQPFMTHFWNGRLTGVLLTGALMDYSLDQNLSDQAQLERLMNAFGLYHACWLLLLFVCIIFTLRYSLFINLGIFAGLMYDFSPTAGPYFFPWDMPAMFFLTLAVLFFERRRTWIGVGLVCVGCFFKETVLVSGLLVLFATHWKWKKRMLAFFGIIVVYALGKKMLTSQLDINESTLSIGNALHFSGPFSPLTLIHNLIENLKALFTPKWNSVIFVNGGTLLAALILGWQKRRLLPYMTVIAAFVIGMFFINPPPGIREIRVFGEILPLSVIVLSVVWAEYSGINLFNASAAETGPAWPARETFPLLLPIVVAVVVLVVGIAAYQFDVIYEDLQPEHQAQSQLGKYVFKGGQRAALETLSRFFGDGYADTELKQAIIAQNDNRDADAITLYQNILGVNTNSIYALNNLAMLLATDSDPHLRDGNHAVVLAERACQLSQNQSPAILYTLAAAYAEAGRFKDAVATGEKARATALSQGQTDLAQENDAVLELYKSGQPFHQPSP